MNVTTTERRGGPATVGPSPSRLVLGIAACLAAWAIVAVPTSAGGTQAYLVTVKVAPQSTVEAFMSRRFQETVTCREACKVSTRVLIKAGAARRLGFRNVTGKLVLIATNKAALRARTPTKLTFTLTREAQARLGKATATLDIYASVQAVPLSRPAVNFSVGWASKLT